MADLGTIQYTDVNQGVTVVDRSQEVAALENLLRAGKKITDEAIKGKVTGDMEEAITEAEQSEQNIAPEPAVTSQQVGEAEMPVYPEGSRERHLQETLDRLNTTIEQGTHSQKTAAEMRVKAVLTEAQDKFPWLYEDLQARAGSVLSGSAALEQLGIEDAARIDQANEATRMLEDIVNHARKGWDEGGLGMDPALQPTDPRFIEEYAVLQDLRRTSEEASRLVGMYAANNTLDASRVATGFMEELAGPQSTARAQLEGIFRNSGVQTLYNELAKPASERDLTLIANIQNSGLPQAVTELEQTKNELSTLWSDTIGPRLASTVFFEDARAQHDDLIAQIDSTITRLSALQEDFPDVPTLLKEEQMIRAADFGRQLPERWQTWNAYATSPGGQFMIEMGAQSKTANGLVMVDHMANMNSTALAQLYPEMFSANPTAESRRVLAFNSAGSFEITGAMSPQQINAKIDGRFRESNNPWVVPTRTQGDELDATTKSLVNWNSMWNTASDIPADAGQDFAGDFLTGLNYSMRSYSTLPTEREPAVMEIALSTLAGEGITNAIEVIGTGPQSNERQAFGASAQEFYVNSDPLGRRQEAKHQYENTMFSGVPMWELVAVDIDRMSAGGEFVYVINEEKVSEIAQRRASMTTKLVTTESDVVRETRNLRQSIIQAMDPIAAEVMQQIGIEQNLNRALAPTPESRKRSEVNLEYYTGDNDPGNQLPWIDVFRHVESQ